MCSCASFNAVVIAFVARKKLTTSYLAVKFKQTPDTSVVPRYFNSDTVSIFSPLMETGAGGFANFPKMK